MPTLEDAWTKVTEHTSKASELVRQLSLAGLGFIWIFKRSINGQDRVAPELVLPAGIIVIALMLDLLQYVASSVTQYIFLRVSQKYKKLTDGILYPWPLIHVPSVLWLLKIAAPIVAYAHLIRWAFCNVL